MADAETAARDHRFGMAWLGLCLAFVLHVVDEAATGFLSIYNPSVTALRERFHWLPLPTFGYGEWLAGLIAANAILLSLTPFAFRRARWLRPVAYAFAVIMLFNAIGHTAGTILGRTAGSIQFARPMPGFYSSPALLAASVYMLFRLRATARM